MFKLNFKIAMRNIWKNKGYTLINVLGLSIGMASCILIFLFINHQLSFDKGYKNAGRIYRIVTNWEYAVGEDHSQGVPIPLSAAVKNDFAAVEKVAAIQRSGGIIHVKDDAGRDRIKSDERVYYVQPEFSDIFNLRWLSGNPGQSLVAPDQLVLTEKMAIRLFGSAQASMGKTVFFNKKALKVSGVVGNPPENTSLPLHLLISYASYSGKDSKNWGHIGSGSECYVLLKKGIAIESLKGTMDQFNKKYYNDEGTGKTFNTFQSLSDVHFNELYGNFANATFAKKQIYGLIVIGCFLILAACINFINLSTAQSVSRSKEVGVRKVMGSKRKQLIVQFLTETLSISLIALMIACVLAELGLPHLEALFEHDLTLSLFSHPVIFVFLVGMVLVVSLLAGFYPALIMSGFNPALAIKNRVTVNSGSLGLRKVLVVVQFAITIILIIGTLVILRQMDYVRKKPLGFNPDAVAMVYAPNDSLNVHKLNTLREQMLRIPGVEGMSYCQVAPLSGDVTERNFSYAGKEIKDFQVRVSVADENYVDLFKLKIVAGKGYVKSDTLNGYVVNEKLLKMLNIKNPEDAIGKVFSSGDIKAPIVGVVKDFNDKSLREGVSPMAIYADKNEYYNMAIRIDPDVLLSTMKSVEGLWNQTFPDYVYDSAFVNDDINGYYNDEQIMGVLFRVFAGVIIFISFIGLFGLISYVATQRSREVAIRKVLGASTFELVKMLNGSFLLMVFLANVVAWPLAYLFVSKWLSGFAYRIELSIWPFVAAMLLSMLITLVTVSIRSYRAANVNPIDALKYE
ncbi:putative ABC transporter permease [Pedobacter sp. BAL39]|uniref:ABC transporter permease n=1 Tax=Pedobacter sp. BAL39 TaxID=391596 RepID=UPI0001559495|nr:FtsX-like permease family protein [Pedobacter sp. BAL39]EDM38540.1 putative ABC transporter permease [Pedobacter sp. BAL39]